MQSKPDKGEKSGRPEPEDKKSMCPAQPGPPGALIEAYKKHVEELRGIDDRQSKIIALLLGVLSAAGTLLIKEAAPSSAAKRYMSRWLRSQLLG